MENIDLTKNKDYKAYSKLYNEKEIDILVLFRNLFIDGHRFNNSWDQYIRFIAYIDLQTNELHKGDGSINWLTRANKKFNYPYYFKDGEICKLRVRKLKDKSYPKEGYVPMYDKRFMLVEVLQREVKDARLESVWKEYFKPVIISDKLLGNFQLNRDYNFYKGSIKWLDNDILVYLRVSPSDINFALNRLRTLYKELSQKDIAYRKFAAKKLTNAANNWAKNSNTKITETEFFKRISLKEISICKKDIIEVCYNSDDMFSESVVEVIEHNNKLYSAEILADM